MPKVHARPRILEFFEMPDDLIHTDPNPVRHLSFSMTRSDSNDMKTLYTKPTQRASNPSH
jgi:hypothetical protein